MQRIDYAPEVAHLMTDLVLSRLPMRFPGVDPRRRDSWGVSSAAMLVRATFAVRALFKLGPSDSWLVASAVARTVIEMAITFAWLAGDPGPRMADWIAGNDDERKSADNKFKTWLVEGGYLKESEPLLSPDLRDLVDAEARRLLAVGDRAKSADKSWRPHIAELRGRNCSFAEMYASAYTHYSTGVHASFQSLFNYIGSDAAGVFVGLEGPDVSSTPWWVALRAYALALLVSSQVIGWPDAETVRPLMGAVGMGPS